MTISTTENLLLEKLQKLDKEIEEAERALVHLNKQAGSKITKIKDLKDMRRTFKAALTETQNIESN